MIGIPELLIVAGVLALAGTYLGIIHRLLRGADGSDERVAKPHSEQQRHQTEPEAMHSLQPLA